MIRKILLLLCIVPVIVAVQAQDTRRMYFGISAEPSWGLPAPQPPYKAGAAKFGIHINLQSFKYFRQWFGIYFGLSLVNTGGYISSGISNPAELYRLRYLALPVGIALTTPLKRRTQFNLQLGAAGALNIGRYEAINNETNAAFVPFYQAILSMQYHIGQDVYIHIGPSYLRSITSTTDGSAITAQSIGVRAGIIF